MYIVQFHKTNPDIYRTVNRALFDGYIVGDRLLEGVMFEVLVDDAEKLSVRATQDAVDYLEHNLISVSGWEKQVRKFVATGYDNLSLEEDEDSEWDHAGLHLTETLSWYEGQERVV